MRQGVGVKARYSYAPQQPPAYQMNIQAPTLFTTVGRIIPWKRRTITADRGSLSAVGLSQPNIGNRLCHDRYADAALLRWHRSVVRRLRPWICILIQGISVRESFRSTFCYTVMLAIKDFTQRCLRYRRTLFLSGSISLLRLRICSAG